jgi:hypothetical protein
VPNSVDILEVRIPVARIRALSDAQRHTYYLLGFIFNELICLRKLISFSLQQRGADNRPVRRNPETSQTLFLFRIACAKLWEAHLRVNSKEVSTVFRADVLPYWEGGIAALKDMNKAIADATWLSRLRNTLGFHYPSLSDWQRHITPTEEWVDDVIYAGQENGNLFYDAADSVSRHHMFGQEPGLDPVRVKLMIDEMIDVLGKVTDFIEEGLGIFIATHLLLNELPPEPRHKLSAPKYDELRLPFWTEMSEIKRRKRAKH